MIFNSLQFDGDNSLDHGVYITGEAIYSAPVRDTESIEIPGRNGDFILDKGRWKNIDVTYKAGLFGSDQENFANKIRDYRNILASRIGYKRITDTYNPQEFRLGTLKDGLDVETKSQKKAGEFDIVFDCKPQRYLVSGETEITATRGQVITNPTAYPASPLIVSQGGGYIQIGSKQINLENKVYGNIELIPYTPSENTGGRLFQFQTDTFNEGDEIVYSAGQVRWRLVPRAGLEIQSVSLSDSNTQFSSEVTAWYRDYASIATKNNALLFSAGQSRMVSNTTTVTVVLKNTSSGTTYTQTAELNVDIQYGVYNDGNNIYLGWTADVPRNYFYQDDIVRAWACSRTTVDSTMSALDGDTYIDCELGEVYTIVNGKAVLLNKYVELGTDLPVLVPGDTVINYGSTITSLKIIPRWWIL